MGKDRQVMNKIIHSPDVDQNIRRYGPNPFANNRDWDDDAQERLKEIAARRGFDDVLRYLLLTEHSHRVKGLMKRLASYPVVSTAVFLGIWGKSTCKLYINPSTPAC